MDYVIYKLMTLGCMLLCLSSVARAGTESDFSFIVQPYLINTACGNPIQNATFMIKNNEDVPIDITYITLERKDIFPPDLVAIDTGPLTTCKIGPPGVPGKGTCNINLIVDPSKGCSSNFISADVYRLLHVGINTWEKEVTADPIIFNYQTIGPPAPPTPEDSFAVLGCSVQNLGSISSIIGNIGYSCTSGSITDNYDVTDGTLYTNPLDPEVVAANTEFMTTYQTFIDNIPGCRPISEINSTPIQGLKSSYYCVTTDSASNAEAVIIERVITLSGPGNFVFFIDSKYDPSCFGGSGNAPCNLTIQSSAEFRYKDGASANNVYWIIGTGHKLLIASGAGLDGTVLSGGPISTDPTGPSASFIHGRLWSLDTITLYGDTVAIHF